MQVCSFQELHFVRCFVCSASWVLAPWLLAAGSFLSQNRHESETPSPKHRIPEA